MLGTTKYTDHFNKESIGYRKMVRAAIRGLHVFEETNAHFRNKRKYGYTDKYEWGAYERKDVDKLIALGEKLGFYVKPFGVSGLIIYMPNQPSTQKEEVNI